MKVDQARQRLGASERHACRTLGQPRTTQRRVRKVRADEAALRTDVVRLASRYGYRQITNLLRIEGWQVNYKRVERIWRQEELKVPRRGSRNGAGCGWATARASGSGHCIGITSGPTTS